MSQLNLPCQRWRDHRSSYRVPDEVIRPRDYEVAPITYTQAKEFVLRHHYARSYPSCRFRYGLFSNGELVGVAVFSHPRHPNVLTNVFPGDPLDSVELGRFVLLDKVPANGESWFKARCRELLKREHIIGIVAFSDDTPRTNETGEVIFIGHIGLIYQASNAIYLGRASKATQYLFADGIAFDPRAKSKIRNRECGWQYASGILVNRGADKPGKDLRSWLDHWLPLLTTKFRKPGNHKYAWALSRRIKLPESQPYPKRLPEHVQ